MSFWGLGSSVTADAWGPSTVRVGFNLGAGERAWLVVLEDGSVIGMKQVEAPESTGMTSDGDAIPLDTKLSGKHTIRVAMYPATGKGEFSLDSATPCQHEGKPVQTEPTTIDFSRFSPNKSTTPTTGTE